MDNFDLKKASLLSDKVFGLHEIQGVNRRDLPAPKDKFYIATIQAFITGVVCIIPLTFFLQANDYWMYKFRDASKPTYDANEKTDLQTQFASINTVVTSVMSVIAGTCTVLFAHRIEMRLRFLLSTGLMCVLFVLFTILVKVDTDSWQSLFFGVALIVMGAIAAISAFFGMSANGYFSRFPPFYMIVNLFGGACGGLFGSSLQIICLSVSDDSIVVALIYFSCGTCVIFLSVILSFAMKYSPVVQFYWFEAKETQERKKYTLKDYAIGIKKCWVLLMMIVITFTTMSLTHPNLSNLVVSESYTGKGLSPWGDKYFVVTGTFLLYDFFQVTGRFISRPRITKENKWWYLLVVTIRALVITPLFLFCNARPRTLTVWFPHDYQYMIMMVVFSFSLAVMIGDNILSIPNFAEDKAEAVYTVFPGLMTAFGAVLSPLNPLYIKILKSQ